MRGRIGNVLVAIAAVTAALTFTAGWAPASDYFVDEFDGPALDTAKWVGDLVASGTRYLRYNLGSPYQQSAPGQWLDANLVSGAALPYSSLIFADGQVTLNSFQPLTAVYFWSGPPYFNPFPATGDFSLEIGARFNPTTWYGTGIVVTKWDDTTPVGENPPLPMDGAVFRIWNGLDGYGVGSVWQNLLFDPADFGQTVAGAYDYHVYRLDYIDGAYTLFIDGILARGPVASTLRPNTIWMGNPILANYAIDFNDFAVDYVRVTLPAIQVGVDIKPGSYPNSINLGSGGVVPVAILGSAVFDAAQVNPATVTLASAPVKLTGQGTPVASIEDVNGDGFADLVVQVITECLVLSDVDKMAHLDGVTFAGREIVGLDTVRVVP